MQLPYARKPNETNYEVDNVATFYTHWPDPSNCCIHKLQHKKDISMVLSFASKSRHQTSKSRHQTIIEYSIAVRIVVNVVNAE